MYLILRAFDLCFGVRSLFISVLGVLTSLEANHARLFLSGLTVISDECIYELGIRSIMEYLTMSVFYLEYFPQASSIKD